MPIFMHFNAYSKHHSNNMKCKCCSKRFQKFMEEFDKINSNSIEKFKQIQGGKMWLRNYKNKYIANLNNIIQMSALFKDVLSDEYFAYQNEEKKIKQMKFPVMNIHFIHNSCFSDFYKQLCNQKKRKSIKYFTYHDIMAYLDFCSEKNTLRHDIEHKCNSVYAYEVEYLEQHYGIKCDAKFPREHERKIFDSDGKEIANLNIREFLEEHRGTNDYYDEDASYIHDIAYNPNSINDNDKDIAYITRYSDIKTALLNYFSMLYCEHCVNNYSYNECIAESIYLTSSYFTWIFNNIGKGLCIEFIHSEEFENFRSVVSAKLNEVSTGKLTPVCHDWKGCDFYHDYLCIIPKMLTDCGIPANDYAFRKAIYFDDYIKGHPLASDGWYAESLRDFKNIMENRYAVGV